MNGEAATFLHHGQGHGHGPPSVLLSILGKLPSASGVDDACGVQFTENLYGSGGGRLK